MNCFKFGMFCHDLFHLRDRMGKVVIDNLVIKSGTELEFHRNPFETPAEGRFVFGLSAREPLLQ
jgi:signal transduction histidine kinase